MENYDVALLNTGAMRSGPILDETDVDGMTINSLGQLASQYCSPDGATGDEYPPEPDAAVC